MTEKVKVSREVAEAIESALKQHDKEEIIAIHVIDLESGGYTWHALNGYSLDRLIQALYIGYEIEQTPEEKLVKRFQYCEQRWGWHQDDEIEMKATAEAIKETLETLNIKIKGINE